MSENILIALIGISGAVIGSLGTLAGQWQVHRLKVKEEKSKDGPRRQLLLKMLESNDNDWRKLETLSHVIGADQEKTKTLLIEIGARASEDGKELWALLKNKPLK